MRDEALFYGPRSVYPSCLACLDCPGTWFSDGVALAFDLAQFADSSLLARQASETVLQEMCGRQGTDWYWRPPSKLSDWRKWHAILTFLLVQMFARARRWHRVQALTSAPMRDIATFIRVRDMVSLFCSDRWAVALPAGFSNLCKHRRRESVPRPSMGCLHSSDAVHDAQH